MPLLRKCFLRVLAIAIAASATAVQARVELGIDVLQKQDFGILKGKRVGLVTNQTGINSEGVRTRLILKRAPGVQLVALFAPEHGLDGTEGAGKYISTRKDSVTGLTVFSLYGPTRKPTAQMLNGLDALIYDMQDIGCRSYTYISTMVKCMEAAGEKGIEFIVLDRPNPLGGVRVEGPPMESQWISFVGQLPVPYVHGMTAGELARMANAVGWIQPRCNLTVINLRGWNRRMTWPETGLRWIPTSPNIPRAMSPYYYVVTGLVGELAGFEVGCGGSAPFEIFAARWLDANRFTNYLRSLHLSGVSFSPYSQDGFEGARIQVDPNAQADLTALGIYLLAEANRLAKPDVFSRSSGKLDLFYKCYGSRSIRGQIESQMPVPRIVSSWSRDLARFDGARTPYLLYP